MHHELTSKQRLQNIIKKVKGKHLEVVTKLKIEKQIKKNTDISFTKK